MVACSSAFTFHGALVSAIVSSIVISSLLITWQLRAGGVIKGRVTLTWGPDDSATERVAPAVVQLTADRAAQPSRHVVYPSAGRPSAFPAVARSSSRRTP